jgi:hypothetical protein
MDRLEAANGRAFSAFLDATRVSAPLWQAKRRRSCLLFGRNNDNLDRYLACPDTAR